MSCLSLRLPPAKKAWKSFTSKLQTKLHKLHKPRAINKPASATNTKSLRPYFLTAGQRLQRKSPRRRTLPVAVGYRRRYLFKKRARHQPVYIDQLFREPIPELVENIQHQPPVVKTIKLIDQAEAPGTSKEGEKGIEEESNVADDMWESVGLASPLMQGIDARAEEFITRFRAEMDLQEIIARNL